MSRISLFASSPLRFPISVQTGTPLLNYGNSHSVYPLLRQCVANRVPMRTSNLHRWLSMPRGARSFECLRGFRVCGAISLPQGACIGEGEGPGVLRRKVEQVSVLLDNVLATIDVEAVKAQVATLEHTAADPNIWQDATRARVLHTELDVLKGELKEVDGFHDLLERARFALEYLEVAEPSEEVEILRQALKDVSDLEKCLTQYELRQVLSGPFDDHGAVMTIQAGAGGVDAMDWADMLQRMYISLGTLRVRGTKSECWSANLVRRQV